ncbi:hypothetical protein MTQ01_21820 [Streptomyces sp. XM4193]|uniref:hypothetical protein n=1 Tax=Streptomyces sp. XM4193 TaxID=2929782 RepID=UPI001FFA4E60|nr:hypothetical protein [Streptomyces sp. XM4193]MCK1798615.1 hypothetical protein [Streptomyces sp. XM4193]
MAHSDRTHPVPGPGTPPAPGRRHGRTAALLTAFLVLVVVTVLVVVLPGERSEDDGDACRPLKVTGWEPESRLTGEFARYGDNNDSLDDWTGGDGNRSVALPDGRTLWLAADTFLDAVQAGRTRQNPRWVRNSALVMSPDGTLEHTVLADGPSGFFPGLATPDGREVWRWPGGGTVEPREPGSREEVLRVVLWQRESAQAPWAFGMPRASEVATISLPDLKLESIESIDVPLSQNPAERVLYGTTVLTEGRWTYVFGADERTALGQAAEAHVARVPRGSLADRERWRYWDGEAWQREAARSEALLVGGSDSGRGATNTFSVARRGGTWLLFTADAGGPDGRGLTHVASYWACSPQGPWYGPSDALTPPLPKGAEGRRALAYNPQAHGDLDSGGGDGAEDQLVLGYDVNVPDQVSAVHEDVELYRPRFVTLRLGERRSARREPQRPRSIR